jgi:hypothetical protein
MLLTEGLASGYRILSSAPEGRVARLLSNRRPADGGRAVIYAQRTVFREERRDALRIVTAQRFSVALRNFAQVLAIH